MEKTFLYLGRKEGLGFARKWKKTVVDYISGLKSPDHLASLGKVDPEHYSDRYAHIHIPDTKTTIFLLVEEDQIYLVTSGWSHDDWKNKIKDRVPAIEQQVAIMRERIKIAKAQQQPAQQRHRGVALPQSGQVMPKDEKGEPEKPKRPKGIDLDKNKEKKPPAKPTIERDKDDQGRGDR